MAMKELHPGAKWHYRISGFFSLIFIAVFLGTFIVGAIMAGKEDNLLQGFPNILPFATVALAVIIFWVEIYARLAYKFFKYEFTKDQLRLERGIIRKKYSNIPYQRIQNVDITRGIVARICGFSSVNIQTAGYSAPANGGGSHSEGYIPAVSIAEAEKIREFIIEKISKKTGSGL